MPRITNITMKGFKSFARKTSVQFPVDFSVVVGRNGSGKSNIVDALCFVLGTARSKVMRVKNSAELIFNGGKDGKASDNAEVTVTFDNQDAGFRIDSEAVKVSRLVKSNGQGVYRLNEKRVTRQEILEALSHARINPDSYNIVLQNDVTRVIDMSARERRGFIDDIAGIASYEERKVKALRELDSVERRMEEIQIRLTEMRRILDEMREERDKAVKLRQLRQEKGLVEATLCRSRVKLDEERITRQQKHIAELEDKRSKVLALRQVEEGTLATKQAKLSQVEKRLHDEGYGDQVRLTERRATIDGEITLLKERRKGKEEELSAKQQRLKDLVHELADNTKGLGQAKKALIELAQREKGLTDEIEQVGDRIRKHRKDHDSEWASLEQEREVLEREERELSARETTLREELAKIRATLESSTGKRVRLDDLRKNKTALEKEETELTTGVSTKGEEAARLTRALSDTKHALEKKEQQYSRVRDKLERQARVSPPVEAVLRVGMPGVVGRVYDLIEFSPEHAAAIMAAAGARINAVVVERDTVAVECVQFLKKKRIGKARFLPMDKLRPPPHSREAEGVGREAMGLLRDHVRCEPHLEPMLRYVLGNTVLVETIEEARRLGFGRARMVSLDGDVVESSGAVMGGHNKTERITEDIGALRSDIGRMSGNVAKMEQHRDVLEEELIKMRQRRAEVKISLETIKADLSDMEGVDAATLEKRESELDKELGAVTKDIEVHREKLANIQKKVSARNTDVENEALDKEEGRLTELRDQLRQVGQDRAVKEREKRHEFEANIQMYKTTLREEQKATVTLKSELAAVDKELAGKEGELAKVAAELAEMDEKLQTFIAEQEAVRGDIRSSEKRIATLDRESDGLSITLENDSEKLGEMEGELGELRRELGQFSVFLPDNEDQTVTRLDARLKSVGRRIERLGGVSEYMLERYEEREKEYNESIERKTLLEKEKDVILTTMEELEAKKKEVFLEAYVKVKEHYCSVIGSIEGWSGDLSLENEEEPLEGGLVLHAHPKGKRLIRLESMSGGEKVLTALSLLLALQKFDGAPFLVLDEVDAALDKVNLDRFTELLRDTASKSQLIVISHHNESLMRSADQLIGVSARKGQSMLVGVNLGAYTVE